MCDDWCKTIAMSILFHQTVTIDRSLYRLWVRFSVFDMFEAFGVEDLTFFFFTTLFLLPNIDLSFRVDINHTSLNLQSP